MGLLTGVNDDDRAFDAGYTEEAIKRLLAWKRDAKKALHCFGEQHAKDCKVHTTENPWTEEDSDKPEGVDMGTVHLTKNGLRRMAENGYIRKGWTEQERQKLCTCFYADVLRLLGPDDVLPWLEPQSGRGGSKK